MPEVLRAAGLRLVTLAERYGVPQDENVTDLEWITDAGARGEIVFMKDGRVRYNELEKAAIVQYRVRCFCLSRRDLAGREMAERYLRNLPQIVTACSQAGHFIYAVHTNRIRRLL